ncbi:hypothetical protein PR202_gb03588 [Eleusine coracana subsp. coracana]|uniref:SET domain-containing protein n=1 Tax=Eleusine coracana subsp. coracana TaxID=191504 RepID=A0AAV5E387_ELECO|nr:hypothetical protein PR202_gb03588 [Eleusine coracana subsp. coracana]
MHDVYTSSLKDEDCSGFLHWLQQKAGAQISSVLSVGSSSFGSSSPFDPWQSISIGLSFFFRSLFALEPINKGECIMEVPYDVQLTEDKLPRELCMLLDGVVDNTAKVAVLLMMVQHLGHESGWGPYAKSLPCKDQMHNLMFWDLNKLHMVQSSAIYKEAIEQKDQAKKEFLAIKPVYFLNHDGFSNSILLYDEQKDVSEVIADRNYAVGEQVILGFSCYVFHFH